MEKVADPLVKMWWAHISYSVADLHVRGNNSVINCEEPTIERNEKRSLTVTGVNPDSRQTHLRKKMLNKADLHFS